jgi:hypothetical protein
MPMRQLIGFTIAVSAAALAHSFPTRAAEVTLGERGELRVDGKPLLPIFVWLQPVSNFDMLVSLGINTFMGEGAGAETTKEFLDAAQTRGVWGIIHSREENWPLKDHPALLTWMFGDEPDLPARVSYESLWAKSPGPDGSINIWWEGEQPTETNISGQGWPNMESTVLSGGVWLGLDGNSLPPDGHFHARYRIEVPETRTFTLWSREFGKSWGSPTWWRFDDGEWQHTPRDIKTIEVKRVASNLSIGWHRYASAQLSAGAHSFEVKVDEGRTRGRSLEVVENDYLAAFDAFLLTTSEQEPLTPDPPLRPRVLPEQVAEQYKALKAADPKRPAYLNLTASFYEQFQRYDDATYAAYCRATDIIGYDLYPVTGWGRPEWVPLIGLATAKLRELGGGGVPVWAILECTTKLRWVSQERLDQIGHPRGAHADELRAMVWLAVVNGATGIGYFPHRWEPYRQAEISEELQAEMKRTNRQLTDLAPAILGPDAPRPIAHDDIEGGPVQTLTRQHAGALYVFAVNTTREAARARFRVPAGTRVEAYEEDRTIGAEANGFEDSFAPLGVHVYIIGGG